jgi:hypothetical protein
VLPGKVLPWIRLLGKDPSWGDLPGKVLPWIRLLGKDPSWGDLPGKVLPWIRLLGKDPSWGDLPGKVLPWIRLLGKDPYWGCLPGKVLPWSCLPGKVLTLSCLPGKALSVRFSFGCFHIINPLQCFCMVMEVYVKGFLLFLLAIALSIIGFIIMIGSFFGAAESGMASGLFGQHSSSTPFWISGIIGFVLFLGGIYMLRNRRRY